MKKVCVMTESDNDDSFDFLSFSSDGAESFGILIHDEVDSDDEVKESVLDNSSETIFDKKVVLDSSSFNSGDSDNDKNVSSVFNTSCFNNSDDSDEEVKDKNVSTVLDTSTSISETIFDKNAVLDTSSDDSDDEVRDKNVSSVLNADSSFSSDDSDGEVPSLFIFDSDDSDNEVEDKNASSVFNTSSFSSDDSDDEVVKDKNDSTILNASFFNSGDSDDKVKDKNVSFSSEVISEGILVNLDDPDDKNVVLDVQDNGNIEELNSGRISDASDARYTCNYCNDKYCNDNPPRNESSRNAQMTLKEKKKDIDEIIKDLKMKARDQDCVDKTGSEMEKVLKENFNLKIENNELRTALEQERDEVRRMIVSQNLDYRDLLQKERDDKRNILNEINGFKHQLLVVKNQTWKTNHELTELKELQVNGDKIRREEEEKHSLIIQQLKEQISDLKTRLASHKSENEDLIAELDFTRNRPGASSGEFLSLLRDKVAELTLQFDQFEMEFEIVNVEMGRMDQDLKSCYQDNEELVAELNEMRENFYYSQDEIVELKLQIDDQKRELTELFRILKKHDLDLIKPRPSRMKKYRYQSWSER